MTAKNKCERCEHVFCDAAGLRRHLNRKTPCAPIVAEGDLGPADRNKGHLCRYCGRPFTSQTSMYRHMRHYCKIATTDEGMAKLMDHTLAKQLAEQQERTRQLETQMSELSALIKRQLAVSAVNHIDNRGGTVNQVIDNRQTLVVHQWNAPGGPLPAFDAAFLVRVFASCTELKAYCEMPQGEQMDPDIASPYVARALVETVREAHRDPVYRNVYLNPKRADQVLVCVEEGGKRRWEVRQALEASRGLFDDAVVQMRRAVLSAVERPKMPPKVQDAAAWVPLMYESEPERYVESTKAPMAALYETARLALAD